MFRRLRLDGGALFALAVLLSGETDTAGRGAALVWLVGSVEVGLLWIGIWRWLED